MRPDNLKTKIFLDSGDPTETKEILDLLGFLDGQTTNPSLFAKNPEVQKKLSTGKKFSQGEVYAFYKKVVQEISNLIPKGSVSIEVYADKDTKAEEIIRQAKEMNLWIPNAHIKLPITQSGLEAAEKLAKEGTRLNMTLCFSQEQAAAVYSATGGAKKGQIFISPFIGRLDDRGENGMDLVANILRMFKEADGHAKLLAASVRSYNHLLYSLRLGVDIITAPFRILEEWYKEGMQMPDENYVYECSALKNIEYKKIDLGQDWRDYNINHELTDKGIQKFVEDWNKLVK